MAEEIRNAATETNETSVETEGQEQGRTFTQNEVNAIVRDRLAREREKGSQPNERERDLSAREARLDCREYIVEKSYPAALLDVFSTDNADTFKESVEKLVKAFPGILGKEIPMGTGSSGNFRRDRSGSTIDDPIAAAFK